MKFSLIVATINRREPLDILFRSLCAQTYRNFEVILVDQNQPGYLDDILAKYSEMIDIKRIFSVKGLSNARNNGMMISDGDVFCFPDDDCWYFPDSLEFVYRKLKANTEIFGYTGRCVDEFGKESVAKFRETSCLVNKANVFSTAVSVTLFLRKNDKHFNSLIGAGSGTLFGSGEETDYILCNLNEGRKFIYDPEIVIGHPNVMIMPTDYRAKSYGYGMGYILRQHNFGLIQSFFWIVKPIAASLFYLTNDFKKSKFYFWTFIGRLFGYVKYKQAL